MTRYIALDKTEAESIIRKIKREWFAGHKSLITMIKETITKSESAMIETINIQRSDDADAALPVGNAHASDDILSIVVQNRIELAHTVGRLHNNPNQGHSGLHALLPPVLLAFCPPDNKKMTASEDAVIIPGQASEAQNCPLFPGVFRIATVSSISMRISMSEHYHYYSTIANHCQ